MSRNPYRTCPGLMQRASHLVHLCLRDTPEVAGYQFWGHRTARGAYGNPVDSGVGGTGIEALFTVAAGGTFRSPRLRRSGQGQIVGSTRGQTHVAFDLDDYAGAGSNIPPDEYWVFLRVQENRRTTGLLALAGIPEATVTLNGVGAGDQLVVKGVFFEFQAGVNNLAGKAGTLVDPFLVGLGADDDAAAANLTAALNDNGDVAPAMDLLAPVNTHTFATNVGAPSAVVLIQPEDAGATLLAGDAYKFTISSSDQALVVLDADALAEGMLVWAADAANPVLGPVYCIPPALHFGTRQPTFTLQAIAPSNTACAEGQVPDLSEDLGSAAPRALHLVFTNNLIEVLVRNISANDLLVSFGPDRPMQLVGPDEDISLTSGSAAVREVLLACPDAGGASFTLHAAAATEA